MATSSALSISPDVPKPTPWAMHTSSTSMARSVAWKIRGLREEQGMTQRKLGDVAGMAQTWVSKLEDPNYGKLTISTLLKVASAFDVGLQIDFVPYSKVLSDAVYRTSGAFFVPKFADDPGMVTANNAVSGTVQGTQSMMMGTVITFPENV